jgi:hypothetical protein
LPRDAGCMQLFWRRHRDLEADARSRRAPPARGGTGRWPQAVDGDDAVADAAFYDWDWAEITDFLADQEPCGASPVPLEYWDAVASLLAELREPRDSQIMPAGPVMDRLLDLWSMVHQVGPEAARPVETVLSSLVGRDLVSYREVTEMCERVETALRAQPWSAGPADEKRTAARLPRVAVSKRSSQKGAR